MNFLTLSVIAVLAVPMASFAQTSADDSVIKIEDGYVRSTNPQSGAAFMHIVNSADMDCTLSKVTSDATDRAELHTHKDTGDGVMKMVQIEDGITIPAGDTHELVRGGDHVMFLGLKAPLAQGDEVALTLDFGECGSVDAKVAVDNQRVEMTGSMDKPSDTMEHAAH